MKKFWLIGLLLFAVAGFTACDDDETYVEPQLEVTPNNVAGQWMLQSWNNGVALGEGCYVYMELERKERTFTLYQNLDSFDSVVRTGRYVIETDPELGAVIRGNYDFGGGDWNHRYIITSLTANEMVWVAKDNPTDVSVYVRHEIPAEIR